MVPIQIWLSGQLEKMIDVSNLPTFWVPTDQVTRALTRLEQENNAAMFTLYFAEDLEMRWETNPEWTPEAIAGILGNMYGESNLNPWRWQEDTTATDHGNDDWGYGLVQWTPYTKLTEWAAENGMDAMGGNAGKVQTLRIVFERENGLQWIATEKYNFDFKTFTRRIQAPEEAASAFLYNYERPADPEGSENTRREQARYFYENVVLPIWEMRTDYWLYYFWNYIYSRKYNGRWFL